MERCFECLQCQTSTGVMEVYVADIHPLYWKRIGCTCCHTQWYICTLHPTRRWPMTKSHRALEHFTNYAHMELGCIPLETVAMKPAQSTVSGLSNSANARTGNITTSGATDNDTPMPSPTYDATLECSDAQDSESCAEYTTMGATPIASLGGNKRKSQNLLATSYFSNSVMSTSSAQYFANELDDDGAGICSLVACAFANSTDSTTSSSVDEAQFHLLLLSLLNNLTGPQRQKVVTLLHHLRTHTFGRFTSFSIPWE